MLLALILAGCVPQAPVAAVPQALPALARTVPTDAIPVGKSQRKVLLGDRELLVYFHRPEHWQQKRMLLVMHGVLRNADDYRDHAVAMGDRFDEIGRAHV